MEDEKVAIFPRKFIFQRKEDDKNSFKSGNRIEGLSCCMCLQQTNGLLLCFLDMKEAYACLKASKNDAMIFFSCITKWSINLRAASIVKTHNRYKDTYTQVILPIQSLLSSFYSFSSPNPSSPLPPPSSISPAVSSSFFLLLTLSSPLPSSLLFSIQFYVTKFKIFIAIAYKIGQEILNL